MEKLQALVLDDNWYNCDIFRIALQRAGYEVEIGHNGRDGLAMLRNKSYQMLVIDLHMPGVDGETVLKEIHDTPIREGLYILVITAGATLDAQKVQGLCDRVMFKPVKISELTEFLADVKGTQTGE